MSAETALKTVEPAAPAKNGKPPQSVELTSGKRTFKWTDYEAPSDAQLDQLAVEHDFHPLTIEDAKEYNQRAKVLPFDNYLFISIHWLASAKGEIEDHEIEVFLGRDYIITVHREQVPFLALVRSRFEKDTGKQSHGADYLLYLILDEIIDGIFAITDEMDGEIDQLEDETITNATNQTLQRIFRLKQELINMRRTVAPMRDVANALASTRFDLVDPKTALYFRDAYDRFSRIQELIETERDLLGSALDTYLSVVSNRLNVVMKRLTAIATIFLPISFIAGLGGMNFPQLPFQENTVFWIMVAAMFIVPGSMLIYFWRHDWL